VSSEVGIRGYARLTVVLCRVSLHRFTEYRVDFLVGVASLAVRVLCQVALISVVFSHVEALGGWTYPEALFLVGFAMLPRGLDRLFTEQLWILSYDLVRTGDFFRYLLRPVSPLYLLLSERFLYPDGLGELVVGTAIVGTATTALGVGLSPLGWVLLALGVVAGAIVHAAIKCTVASIAFWMSSSLSVMSAVNQLADFATYPMTIYPPFLRIGLTWVLPFAFTAYLPVQAVLSGDLARLWWLLPAVGGSLTVAAVAYRRGIGRYEMSGS
jgi:ABC-2 type transport system permease protein